MKLPKPVYKVVGEKESKRYKINYVLDHSDVMNTIGSGWVDHGIEIIKNRMKNHKIIVTDSDLVAHEDYIEAMIEAKPVIAFVVSASLVCASPKRLRNAQARLNGLGFTAKYFASETSMLKWLTKQ